MAMLAVVTKIWIGAGAGPGGFLPLFQTCGGRVQSPGERKLRMSQLSKLNQTNTDQVRLRLSRRWAFVLIVALLVGFGAQFQVYAIDPTDTFYGSGALSSVTTGYHDSAFGYQALQFNTTGNSNTATGTYALEHNTTGNNNTASGDGALYFNTIGSNNTAAGLGALLSNTSGNNNTATGYYALVINTTGSNNTANGYQALYNNTTGSNNLANGYQALYSNTTGYNNMASGALALFNNTTGFYNIANGSNAMVYNTTGRYNVAEGLNALRRNTTGGINTAVGLNALLNNTTGGANIALGGSAGSALTTGSYNIDIGNVGVAAEANTIRIGTSQTRAFVAGVKNTVVSGGVPVYVSANGQLGTNPSSKRFKEEIAAMDKKSEAILALHPVTFRYKQELDPNGTAQFGLIAEEVAKVNPDLVTRDDKGEIYSVRYEAVNAMLLNEFLKEHRKVEELKTAAARQEVSAAQQRKEIGALKAALEKQAAQIQRVSVKLATQMANLSVAEK